MDRVAACTGPNATGECVVVDVVGISTTVLEELMPEAAPVAELASTHDSWQAGSKIPDYFWAN